MTSNETTDNTLRHKIDRNHEAAMAGQLALRDRMDAKFDAVLTRMDARFDAVLARMDARFAAVDAKFDAMQAKIDARFAAVDEKFDKVNATIFKLAESVADLRGFHKAILWILSGLTTLFASLFAAVAKALHWF